MSPHTPSLRHPSRHKHALLIELAICVLSWFLLPKAAATVWDCDVARCNLVPHGRWTASGTLINTDEVIEHFIRRAGGRRWEEVGGVKQSKDIYADVNKRRQFSLRLRNHEHCFL